MMSVVAKGSAVFKILLKKKKKKSEENLLLKTHFGGVIADKQNRMDICIKHKRMCCCAGKWKCSVNLLFRKSLD